MGSRFIHGGITTSSLILLLTSAPAAGQTHRGPMESTATPITIELTLEDAVRRALDASYDIYRLQQRYLQLNYGLEAVRRGLGTQINLESMMPRITQGFVNRHYSDDLNRLRLAVFRDDLFDFQTALNIARPLPTDGTLLLSGQLRGYDRSLEMTSQTSGGPSQLMYASPRLLIRYTQPLFQFNEVKGRLQEARLDLEALQLSYGEIEIERINEVVESFFELWQAQQWVEVLIGVHDQNLLNLESVRSGFEAGLVPEMDRLIMEVEVGNSRDRLQQGQALLLDRQLGLDRRLGLSLDERIKVVVDESFDPVVVGQERARQFALENRSDMRRTRIEREKLDLDLRRTISRGRPDLQLDLGYDLSGNSTLPPENTFSRSWTDHLRAGFDPENLRSSLNVNVWLSVPIFDSGANRSEVDQLRAERNILERGEEDARLRLLEDVARCVAGLNDAGERIHLQRDNRRLAWTAYEASRERFRQGEIGTSELLLTQQRFMETESNYLDACVDYHLLLGWLQELTLWDWEQERPIVPRTMRDENRGVGS